MVDIISRKKNSLRNMIFSILAYVIQVILGFIVRRYFIYYLGTEYLGLNSLFTNIISILSFAELGFGSIIVFAMYKPMADNDKEKVKELLNFYKKCYTIIGVVVLLIGMGVLPFMSYFKSKAPNVDVDLYIVYLIFLFNSVITYFFSYRRALLYTSQRNDIESKVNIIINICLPLLQIIAIIFFHSYYLYIVLIGIMGIVNNLIIYLVTNVKYKEYVEKPDQFLGIEERKLIRKDIGAMFFHKIGAVVVYGTDSLIIYLMLGSSSLGKYSNYLLITSSVSALIGFILSSLRGSVGNHIAKENIEKNAILFDRLNFIYLLLVSVCSICIFNLSDSFIDIILTKGESGSLLFDKTILILVSLNFYFNQTRFMVQIFKECAGLFYQDRVRPLFESLVNLIFSIVLTKYLGLAGVIIGTILSNLLVNLWVEPYILNKYYLKKSTTKYILKYSFYTIVMFAICTLTYFICKVIPCYNLITFILKVLICLVITTLCYIILFIKNPNLNYFKALLTSKIKYKNTHM